MIHISTDKTLDKAKEWALSAKLPWLTLMHANSEAFNPSKYNPDGFLPYYVLIDGDGQLLIDGSEKPDSVFTKIKELK